MLLFRLFVGFSICCSVLTACQAPQTSAIAEAPPVELESIQKALSAHLETYFPRIIDTENGGYYSRFSADWTRDSLQPKMMVTQARGLWLAARAAALFPENPVYQQAADHGFRFLVDSMWDHQQGGFRLVLEQDKSADQLPHTLSYAHAFGIYSLAAYARLDSTPRVMSWLEKSFLWLEKNAHDPQTGGYRSIVFSAPPQPDSKAWLDQVRELNWGEWQWKDQNTSIHILEALAETYHVWPDSLVGLRLAEMLTLVRDTMVQPEGYLGLYFTPEWEAVSNAPFSRAEILADLHHDHRSFGHDIETAFLLVEAAEVRYGAADARTWQVAARMIEHTLAHGFAPDYFGLYYEGYKFPDADTVEIVNPDKIWWAQAEAWHALGLFADHFPENDQYRYAYRRMWQYIQQYMIDQTHGGWYGQGWDQGDSLRLRAKAHPWKGGYHDGRALMQRYLATAAEASRPLGKHD